MKTDREKLINWIRNTYVSNSRYTYKATVDDTADAVIADILIDNGIVVQRWIPVTDKLPERFRAVLAYCPNNKNIYEVYFNARGEWHFFDTSIAGEILDDIVTHWMPLPEPPKEWE